MVVGPGNMGLPLAMRPVAVAHEVAGNDADALLLNRLEVGESSVEALPYSELAAALNSERFHPSANPDVCTGFDVAGIAVLTPLRTACRTSLTSRCWAIR